jgi:hypothetical protein
VNTHNHADNIPIRQPVSSAWTMALWLISSINSS